MDAALIRRRSMRGALVFTTCLVLVGAASGVSCDAEAEATFRQAAVDSVGDGVKSIVNGILDGAIAAIKEAGDDPAEEAADSSN